MAVDPEEIENDVLYQVGALAAFARSHGTALVHVKPHGALYHQAARDETVARAVARGVRRADSALVLVGLASSSVMRRAAAEAGLRFAGEAFADRAYEADGSLRSRRARDAIVSDPRAAAEQAVRIARDGIVVTPPRVGRSRSLPRPSVSTVTPRAPRPSREPSGRPSNRRASRSALSFVEPLPPHPSGGGCRGHG